MKILSSIGSANFNEYFIIFEDHFAIVYGSCQKI